MEPSHINPVGDWRAPSVPEDDVIVFDEPGRIVNGVDFTSHYYRCTRNTTCTAPLMLRVLHGAGEVTVNLGYSYRGVEAALSKLDSDSRYLIMHTLYETHRNAEVDGYTKSARIHKEAFAEGRLKKRKVRGQPEVKVWIESKPLA